MTIHIIRKRNMLTIDRCILDEDISIYAFKIYIYLLDRVNEDLNFDMSSARFSKILKMAIRTLAKGLKELEKNGFIHIEHRYHPDGGKDTNLISILKRIN